MPLDDDLRDYFDAQMDAVIERLPARVRELLEEVPLYVEDYPSKRIRAEMGVRRRDELQGLYSGVPLPERTLDQAPVLSEVIYLFREGILSLASDRAGAIDEASLREQIRITLLHELGHHFGMTETQLDELGYG